MKKLNLNPNEMAFRKIYTQLVVEEKVTTVFRPERRLCGDFRGYCKDQIVKIRIIDKVGTDWASVRPKFIPKISKKVRILKTEIKKIKLFVKKDFEGSSPDVYDKQSLKYHLGLIYDLSQDEIGEDFIVTKIVFKYI